VYTVTTTAGNGFTLQWQTSNSSGNVAATSIATSNGDVCVIDSNSGTNAMGMGHCTNLVGGSTTFRIYFASTPSSWAMLTGAEISHFGGVDCIGGPLDTANTGTAGTTFYSAYCTTNNGYSAFFWRSRSTKLVSTLYHARHISRWICVEHCERYGHNQHGHLLRKVRKLCLD